MNRNLFIHRVQLPQRDRQQVSNDHTPIPGMNLFGPTPGPTLEPNTQQQESPVEKTMKPDEQLQRVPPTLSAALAHGMAMPKRHASLGEAAAAATGQGKSEGEGQGGRQGGQERPSHSSYYNPVPVGGMSMPQRSSTIGDAVVQREAAQKRRRSQSI